MDNQTFLQQQFQISPDVVKLIQEHEIKLAPVFEEFQKVAEYNQYKVLAAFQKEKISTRHFKPTTGYGYDSEGRDALGGVFKHIFGAQAAIVSPLLASGTHTISVALFGLLRPNDAFLCITGKPYDTLLGVIGAHSETPPDGSLRDFGIEYLEVPLLPGGKFDIPAICKTLKQHTNIKVIYAQRSRGYEFRPSISIDQLKDVIEKIRPAAHNIPIIVDNCYCEFCSELEPTQVGAQLIMGSLIKNPGGGLAPTGGYIAGDEDLISKISHRLTAANLGLEIGSYAASYTPFFQGIFLASHVTCQALKGAALFSSVLENRGFEVFPTWSDLRPDITQSICFGREEPMVQFIQGIQQASPVDSHVTPYGWDMPGYDDPVIMAAGTFVDGASIELSADGPIRPPYIAYLQGGLTYEHTKLALMYALQKME